MEKIQSMNWNKFSKFEQYTPVKLLPQLKSIVVGGGGGVESDYSVCPCPLLQFLQFLQFFQFMSDR